VNHTIFFLANQRVNFGKFFLLLTLQFNLHLHYTQSKGPQTGRDTIFLLKGEYNVFRNVLLPKDSLIGRQNRSDL